jgi:phosphatidylglycerophosphatase A
MAFRDRAVLILATGFGIGKIPVAPGTFGSILGLPLGLVLAGLRLPLAITVAGVFVLIAVWIAHDAEKIFKQSDPGSIVIDEIAGMAVTLIGLPINLTIMLTGFVVFRILDIVKPFPIRYLDQRLKGGWGVVMDDVAAGIIANLALRIGIHFWA